MSFRDIMGMCFRNLTRRRTRTILAIIGVVVGTCAIVVMLSIGFGLTQSYQEQIESYGNLHMITLYNYGGGGSMPSYGGKQQDGVLNDKTLAAIEKIDGVDAVTPVVSQYLTFGIGKYVASAEVRGVKPEVLEKFNYTLQEGRLLESGDKDALLFGSEIPNWFYNPNSRNYDSKTQRVITDKIIMTGDWNYGRKNTESDTDRVEYPKFKMKGVGLLASDGGDSDYCVFMNINRLEEIVKENRKAEKQMTMSIGEKTYQQAMVYVGDLDKVEDVYNILKDQKYQVSSPISWLAEFKKIAHMIQMVLGGIGGISLFVAALSIANTMIMSIYERTREIGVMKVIGSNLRDIKRMFLMEAGLIGFIGGVVGVVISLIISLLMNTVLREVIGMFLSSFGGGGSTISVVPLWLVLAAVAFSTAIGVIAGYSPAKRAMNLSALESLRNE